MTAHCSPIRIPLPFCIFFCLPFMSYKQIASKCFSEKRKKFLVRRERNLFLSFFIFLFSFV